MESTVTRNGSDQRSLVGLFSDLWRETATLVRDEAELAKAEITEKVSQVQSAAVELAAGAAILYAGFLVLLAAAALGLAQVLPPDIAPWLAPLVVGLVVAGAGIVLLVIGRNKIKAGNLAPQRTIESLRRDAELAKGHVR
jgi:xanthine/uracil permease